MHSYGSGAGGLWAVASATAIIWLFLIAAAVRHLMEIRGYGSPIDPRPGRIAENEEITPAAS